MIELDLEFSLKKHIFHYLGAANEVMPFKCLRLSGKYIVKLQAYY